MIATIVLAGCTLAVEPVPTSALPASVLAPTLAPATETAPLPSTPGAACPDPDALNLANVVASGYAFTSPKAVIGLFCNGAEFEDIVIALETEDQTGIPAEDLLAMLAAGMSWDEVWQSIGLIE